MSLSKSFDYVASVSHDLKSPLSAILGFVEMIKQDIAAYPVPGHIMDDLDMVESLGEEMLALIGNMLTATRIQAGKEPISPIYIGRSELRKRVSALERTFQAEARSRKVEFSVQGSDLPPFVCWDVLKIRYFAVNNLISNALKFVGEGGKVQVRVSVDNAGLVTIVVADNGPGIPPRERRAIFEKFSQASNNVRSFGGSGFGLFNAAHVVHAHQGSIEVKDGIDGKGVAFEVKIPVTPCGKNGFTCAKALTCQTAGRQAKRACTIKQRIG